MCQNSSRIYEVEQRESAALVLIRYCNNEAEITKNHVLSRLLVSHLDLHRERAFLFSGEERSDHRFLNILSSGIPDSMRVDGKLGSTRGQFGCRCRRST